uniref:Integrator complex subunit 4 n=1 Tax=Sphenodon punctatus TaxID=8508 RepID=A0A8D0H8L1_SPHPU
MAAHLKKRVYEEFSKVVVQQQHEEISTKKLRLTKPSKSAALHVDLCKATSPADALQYLLQFARKPVEAESVEGVVRILLEHYYKENDASVRLKIASLLGLLSKTAGFSPDCIMDDAINTLQNEKSHQVLAQLLDTLLVIGTKLPESPAVRTCLVDVACKHLTDSSHGVRNKCLQLIGCLGSVEKGLAKDAEGQAPKDVQKIIADYFNDQDPRVRTAAIKAMSKHGEGLQRAMFYWIPSFQACKLLSDDYEQVRSAAVQLTWVLSQLYPESEKANGEVLRIKSLRKILGSVLDPGFQRDEQPVSKVLDLDLRGPTFNSRLDHDGGVSIRPPLKIYLTLCLSLSLLSEVRIAAVEALCMLAQSSPAFAEKCLDFLVDMFNDEIEEVRLQSIHTMRKISNNITLREDQLDTVLAVLEDSSRDIREALHELLCCTNVSTKEGIHLALVELLKNLTKYPTDRDSIWKCLKFLGSRHPTLVLPLVPELLSTHPFFDTPEPDMDDPAYIAVLVLIFNAAKTCPTMPALFSDHTFRHYAYLRDSLSHLVPPLRLPGRKLVSSPVSTSVALHEDPSQQFLQQSLDRVYNLQHLDPQGTQELLEFTIRDLQRLGELQSELAGMADFSAAYLRCQLLLTKALQEKLWDVAAPLYVKQSALASAAVKQIMEETYKMEFMYSNLETRQVAITHHMRLQAKALQLIVTEAGFPENLCFISELPHMQDSFVDKLLDLMPRLVTSKPSEVVKILQTILRQSSFLRLPLPEQIHRASATIIEPAGESDNPLRFTTGLVVALDVDATLEHVQDPQNAVKVQVLYPDGQAQLIHPKPADFRNPGPGRHRLITQVYLSHTAWTEACQVEVRLLLAYNSGRNPASPRLSRSSWVDSLEALPQSENGIEGTIPFSKPVKVYIMPKPARR